MSTYVYEGPVTSFGRLLDARWTGKTIAASEAKAKSNLTFQVKREYNLLPTARIELPGVLIRR